MDPEQTLRDQVAVFGGAADALLADAECRKGYVRAVHFLSELQRLRTVVQNPRLQTLLGHAVKEYQFAVIASSFALYRQAFAALRLAFELILGAILFSADERRLRKWLRGELDINWQSLIDENDGVLAKSFVRVFCEVLVDQCPQYRGLAITVYRECSEYVHGNASTHDSLPESISFSRAAFLAWTSRVDIIRDLIVFTFVTRFFEEFASSKDEPLRELVIDVLGHQEAVRAIFGGTVGG